MNFGRGWGPRNIVEPLNATVLAIVPEQRPNSVDPLARRYTCDSSPGKGATAGDHADAARPECFAASTAPCSDGHVARNSEQGGGFRGGRLAMNVMLLSKTSRIN